MAPPPAATPFIVAQTAGSVALVNGTPTLLTATAPNDGKVHTAIIGATLHVTGAETGGNVAAAYTSQGQSITNFNLINQNQGTGSFLPSVTQVVSIDPGSTLTISQSTALTAGAATVQISVIII